MARIRSFKPELLRHPVIGRLPEFDFKVLMSSIAAADDEGYFRADAHIFRGDVMPFEDNLQSITESLRRLSEIGWITICEHTEQGKIARISKWTTHQKISHPSQSKIKVYFDSVNTPENFQKAPELFRSEQGAGSRDKEQGLSTCATDVAPGTSRPGERAEAQSQNPIAVHETVLTDGPLHSHVRALIRNTWLRHNPNVPTCPWDGKEGKLLDTLLKKTPQWTLEHYRRCLENLFASDHFTVSTPPGEFILLLPKYLNGPLNEYKNPKGSERVDAREAVRRREANVGVFHPPAAEEATEERIPIAKAIANFAGGKVMR
jgi:hypothetical protein